MRISQGCASEYKSWSSITRFCFALQHFYTANDELNCLFPFVLSSLWKNCVSSNGEKQCTLSNLTTIAYNRLIPLFLPPPTLPINCTYVLASFAINWFLMLRCCHRSSEKGVVGFVWVMCSINEMAGQCDTHSICSNLQTGIIWRLFMIDTSTNSIRQVQRNMCYHWVCNG